MDRQRSQAIDSLEISDHSVKCQKCGIAVPIVGKLTKPKARNYRIAVLEKQIKWIEAHSHSHHGNNNRSSDDDNDGSIKQLKQELAELLAEEAKVDKLTSLPLYSCRITGFKFVCSKCYHKVV
jgi:adenine-specific DNA methylase